MSEESHGVRWVGKIISKIIVSGSEHESRLISGPYPHTIIIFQCDHQGSGGGYSNKRTTSSMYSTRAVSSINT